jgi:hypothetical protein
VLQEITETSAAVYGHVLPVPAGLPIDEEMRRLATTLGIDESELRWFSTRDTIVTDANGQLWSQAGADPSVMWLYRPAPDQAAAEALCALHSACTPLTIEGAASAAASDPNARIVVLERLAPGTPVEGEGGVDDTLQLARADFGRLTIYVLDGGRHPSTQAGEFVLYTSAATAEELSTLTEACSARPAGACFDLDLDPP